MSRVGKKPIIIPESVEVKISDSIVTIRGPKGELSKKIPLEIKAEIKESKIFISPKIETKPRTKTKLVVRGKKTKALWGLTRALISNMIKGVVEGYEKKLQIEGIGYRANLDKEDLVLQVGFSHPVKIKKEKDIKFSVEKNIITVSGINKEIVSQVAATIRKIRPPEPYKGKGIRYLNEQIRKKVGKKVVTAE